MNAQSHTNPQAARGQGQTALLEDVIDPVVQTMGYELVHVEWNSSGQHRRLCIFLDIDGGIGLADCAKMSPVIGNALDAAESDPAVAQLLSGGYALEVSSPGLDRPLSRRGHFERQVGKRAKITTLLPLYPSSKQKNFDGRIEAVSVDPHDPDNERSGTVVLLAEDGTQHAIAVAQIRRANLVFEG